MDPVFDIPSAPEPRNVAHGNPAHSSQAPWRRPFEKWLDGVESGWAVPLLLLAFVMVWTIFFVVAYSGGDLHPDALEAWSVGRSLSWGFGKHPPLMGWFTHFWFLLFPVADWSFYLLAMCNAAIALWAVDLITRRFVTGDKRIVVLLLLMLMPAYQFHAQRFNANTVLLAIWPLATYCFIRSFETRSIVWSAATGVLCAVAMLGKYYSIFLIAGFILGAVVHPQRRTYLMSFAPWVSTIAGLIALGPHLYWLATSDALPFTYAMNAHSGWTFWPVVWEVWMFFAGIAGYLALPLFIFLLMIRKDIRSFVHEVSELPSGLKLLLIIFLGTIVLPAITAIVLVTDLPPLWNLQGLFFVVVIVVCCTKFPIERFDTVNVTVLVVVMGLGAILAAPIHALYRNNHPFDLRRNYLSTAALELTKQWESVSDLPLARVSGSDDLAFAMAFYSPMHPVYSRPFHLQGQWGMPRRSLKNGWAAMCFTDDHACTQWLRKVELVAQSPRRIEFDVQRFLWSKPGPRAKVVALMVPPQAGAPVEPLPSLHDDGVEEFSASRRRDGSSAD